MYGITSKFKAQNMNYLTLLSHKNTQNNCYHTRINDVLYGNSDLGFNKGRKRLDWSFY